MVLTHKLKQFSIVLALLVSALIAPIYSFTLLPADSLKVWMDKDSPFPLLLIDIRDTIEVAGGIISNTNTRPYHMSYRQFVLRDSIAKLPKNMAIVLYCASGNRSGTASKYLDSLQFSKVYSLVGGFNEWNGPKGNKTAFKSLSSIPEASIGSTSSIYINGKNEVAPLLWLKQTGDNKLIYTSTDISAIHDLKIYNSVGVLILKHNGALTNQSPLYLPKLQSSAFFAHYKYQNRIYTQVLK